MRKPRVLRPSGSVSKMTVGESEISPPDLSLVNPGTIFVQSWDSCWDGCPPNDHFSIEFTFFQVLKRSGNFVTLAGIGKIGTGLVELGGEALVVISQSGPSMTRSREGVGRHAPEQARPLKDDFVRSCKGCNSPPFTGRHWRSPEQCIRLGREFNNLVNAARHDPASPKFDHAFEEYVPTMRRLFTFAEGRPSIEDLRLYQQPVAVLPAHEGLLRVN